MYEDSWYSFVPPSNHSNTASGDLQHSSKSNKRESLLLQPNESGRADTEHLEAHRAAQEERECPKSPPKATIVQRARSFSAFYDAAIAQERKDGVVSIKASLKSLETPAQGRSIKDDLDCGGWYDAVEDELQAAADAEDQLYEDQLILARSHIDALLENTLSTLGVLASLSASFKAVDSQTTAFRARCESLLAEQHHMTKIAGQVEENLQYYSYLDPISRRLNAPNAGAIVGSREFSEMLATIDHCLKYMKAHSNHQEAETYRARYAILMTRALTLIRNHFVTSLRSVSADVSKRITDHQLNDTTMSALLYAKFRVGAPELKEVGKEVQKRALLAEGTDDGIELEYQSLMNELYQSYSAARGRLVIPLVRKKIAEIAAAPSTSKDLVSFARSSLGYVRGICLDEFQLWGEWFEGNDGLYDFLESTCEPLYDHLRPRIIHETQILKLCELCTLLQTRYMRDEEDEAEAIQPGQLDFSSLATPILEDAQTRLVFRAQTVLRDEIERYKPKPVDLDYPARGRRGLLPGVKSKEPVLSGRKDSSKKQDASIPKTPRIVDEAGDDIDTRDARWGFDTGSTFDGYFPTLKKAIWLLSRIYRLVNSTVFDDLAHQIVHQTTISLHNAAALIRSKATPIDGQLFLIKHLLLLKSQIVAFDIEFVTPEVGFDFSAVTSTFWELRERGGLFNPTNLFKLVGGGLLPQVVENMLDAKVELDGRLRTVINDLTNGSAANTTKDIAKGITERQNFDANTAVGNVRQAVEKEIPLLRRKLEEYLDDARTKETLVAAVENQIIQDYEDFYDTFAAQSRSSGKSVSKKGKGKEDSVWDVDTFSEWMAGVCNVGKAEIQIDDIDSSRSRSVSQTSK